MKRLERAGGANDTWIPGHLASAYKSLAKSRGVSVDTVLEAAQRDDLRSIVELREMRRPLNPSLPGWGTKDPIDCLAVLSFKGRDPLLR